MSTAATFQFLCPACGQAFLTRAQHALSVQSCPHCSFTGTADHFYDSGNGAARAVDIRRRQVIRRSTTPMMMASTNPNGWDVRTYEAIQPAPMIGPMGPVIPMPMAVPVPMQVPMQMPGSVPMIYDQRMVMPQEQQWETMQAFSSPTISLPAPELPPLPEFKPAAPPAQRMAAWSPMKAPGNRALTPWTTLDVAPADDPNHFVPRQRRSFVPVFILMFAIVATGVVGALWLDKKSAARAAAWLREHTPQADGQVTIAKAEPLTASILAPTPEPPAPPESLLTANASAQRIDALLTALCSATTTDQRLECLADGGRARESVEEFFKKHPQPLVFNSLRPLPAKVYAMPGNYTITLCAAEAALPEGTVWTLVRLGHDDKGETKLDWNTLQDSIDRKLANYVATPSGDPKWITLGVRRSFGFDEPADIREAHHIFDIQGLGDGSDRAVAFIPRQQPAGVSLDNTLHWDQLYMIRALVHWITLGGQQRLTILDAELIPGAVASR